MQIGRAVAVGHLVVGAEIAANGDARHPLETFEEGHGAQRIGPQGRVFGIDIAEIETKLKELGQTEDE